MKRQYALFLRDGKRWKRMTRAMLYEALGKLDKLTENSEEFRNEPLTAYRKQTAVSVYQNYMLEMAYIGVHFELRPLR